MVHADMSEPEDKSEVRGEGGGGEQRERSNGQQSNSIHVRNNDVYFRVRLPSNKANDKLGEPDRYPA